jgi:hypothetical protein
VQGNTNKGVPMLIKLSKSEVRTIAFALYLASAWEDSIIDSYRLSYTAGGFSDPRTVRKCRSNITKFQKLKLYLLNSINALPLIK